MTHAMKTAVPIILAVVVVGVLAFRMPPHAAAPAFATAAAPHTTSHRRVAARMPVATIAVVYVAGAVARPGLYRLAPGARADDAVRAAGGMRPGADPVAVNLAARVGDGDEIIVPLVGHATPHPRRTARSRTASPPPEPVALNVVGAAELARVPGIGPAIAGRIIAFRDANGPFTSLDELLDVNGVTAGRLDRAAPYLVVP